MLRWAGFLYDEFKHEHFYWQVGTQPCRNRPQPLPHITAHSLPNLHASLG